MKIKSSLKGIKIWGLCPGLYYTFACTVSNTPNGSLFSLSCNVSLCVGTLKSKENPIIQGGNETHAFRRGERKRCAEMKDS